MPVYEYKCISCNQNKEISRGFNDNEVIPVCNLCNSQMIRVYTPAGIQFKGSGFYKTDNG